MPLYGYRCPTCLLEFELRQSFWAEPSAPCPHCRSESRRRFHPVPVIYKGSGFYTTDYRSHGNGRAPATEEAGA